MNTQTDESYHRQKLQTPEQRVDNFISLTEKKMTRATAKLYHLMSKTTESITETSLASLIALDTNWESISM